MIEVGVAIQIIAIMLELFLKILFCCYSQNYSCIIIASLPPTLLLVLMAGLNECVGMQHCWGAVVDSHMFTLGESFKTFAELELK